MRKMSDIVRHQDPLTLPPDVTVKEACRHMRDRRVGAVLVTEADHRLIGIFTGRDAVHRVLAEGKSADRTTLSEVMTLVIPLNASGADRNRGAAADARRALSPCPDRRRRQGRWHRVTLRLQRP